MSDLENCTVTLWRFRFENSPGFEATGAHHDYQKLARTWHAGILERQTVTYSAWETSEPPTAKD